MSEIINNRQKRVELMKSLIRQLHQGMAEDRVRKQLETLLDEADYNDVFVMEVQLIQEGIQMASPAHQDADLVLDIDRTGERAKVEPDHRLLDPMAGIGKYLFVGRIHQVTTDSN